MQAMKHMATLPLGRYSIEFVLDLLNAATLENSEAREQECETHWGKEDLISHHSLEGRSHGVSDLCCCCCRVSDGEVPVQEAVPSVDQRCD